MKRPTHASGEPPPGGNGDRPHPRAFQRSQDSSSAASPASRARRVRPRTTAGHPLRDRRRCCGHRGVQLRAGDRRPHAQRHRVALRPRPPQKLKMYEAAKAGPAATSSACCDAPPLDHLRTLRRPQIALTSRQRRRSRRTGRNADAAPVPGAGVHFRGPGDRATSVSELPPRSTSFWVPASLRWKRLDIPDRSRACLGVSPRTRPNASMLKPSTSAPSCAASDAWRRPGLIMRKETERMRGETPPRARCATMDERSADDARHPSERAASRRTSRARLTRRETERMWSAAPPPAAAATS